MICGSTGGVRRRASAAAAATGVLLTLLSGCGASGSGDGSAGAGPTPHGHVEGAEETAEPQWRLILAAARGGRIHSLDPATGRSVPVGEAAGLTAMRTDGRHAYLTTGDAQRVVDTGVWTVDHGDHVHYYRAPARTVGDLRAAGTPEVAGDLAVTTLAAGGAVRVLDRKALDDGKIQEPARVEAAVAVPYAGHLLAASDGTGHVAVHDREGHRISQLPEPCPDPRGQAITRRGAVLGCSDGALLVTGEDGRFAAEKIPYPGEVPAGERALEFRHRPGSNVLAAAAGDKGAWVLDIAARTWKRVGSVPAVAVNAVGEDSPVLLLGRDGVLRSYDPGTGKQEADVKLLKDTGSLKERPSPVIQVDTMRAYVNDPAGNAVHEIDYNDDLRKARSFKLPFAPAHMVETGW
ncbi:hypothetical protein E1281_28900 [Actinomadura sp. KC345]|uniref:hypothetical protein n=1 Tax=Actinomadura sp. KC345 TaxID=2530371 RepID=UPI001045C154|nr:hypothetical protein [Actinomadura sp. KC345]TDC46031.1 hypothetical protein E1281_28900 [Actinomadura sp. KC345]